MTKYFAKPREAADMLQVSTRTLSTKRALGNGPPYLKMDGVIRYPLDGLENYINKNLHHNARAKNK
ncbi:MAG: DNA-binding protein [Pelagibacterales bacterium]|nr:DNA-binding protein [Pelagibacterales bacterium]